MITLGIVAHPDDLEIGAGGTIAGLVERGPVLIVVMTDEADPSLRATRRAEARAAAQQLGIARDELMFLGQPDRYAHCDPPAVEQVRNLVGADGIRPDLLITHTSHDWHEDHCAVHRLAAATYPTAAVHLYMAVVNSVDPSFDPTLFVDTAHHIEQKNSALDCYRSQDRLGRIRRTDIAELETAFGDDVGFARAEGFELHCQDDRRAAPVLAELAEAFPTRNTQPVEAVR